VTKVEIVPSLQGEDVRVSATSYLAYKQCPARADARYKGNFGKASRSSFVGSLAHQVFRRHLESGPIDEAGFEQACREEIGGSQRLNNSMRDLSMKPSDLNGVFEEVRALYQRFVWFPQEGFEGAEIVFDIAAAAGVELVGQIDAVYVADPDGHRLVDWKTGELGEAREQMGFYALLWMLDRKQLPVSIEAISVKTGERYSSVPVNGDVVKVAGEVSQMVDDLRSHWSSGADFERRGGPWCQYCPVLEGCSEGEATVRILENSG
jgi:hypothetical protein